MTFRRKNAKVGLTLSDGTEQFLLMEAAYLFDHCLLVEDDPAHAHIIQRALTAFCAEVLHRQSLQAAEAEANVYHPDLIVTDLRLFDANGVEVVKKLLQTWPTVPLVVLTSSTCLQDAVEAMKLGAKDFIVKAFDGDFREILGLSLSRVKAALLLEAQSVKLRQEMEALRVAIENSNDGLAVTDSSGALVYYNRSFDLFVKACRGQTYSLAGIFSDRVEHGRELSHTLLDKFQNLAVGAVWHTEVKFVDDKDLAFDLSLSAIRAGPSGVSSGAGKGPNECVVWVRNISEEKRREKFQREILSTTTHDLKNPLAAILTCSDILSEMVTDNQRVLDLVLRIGSSAQGAVNLIDEFLSARRIQEGTFILRPAPHAVQPIVEEVVENFRTIASARSITLRIESEGVEKTWCVDKTGVQRVLSNLLSNAIKFTPPGGQVLVKTQAQPEALHLIVADNGSGMEPSEVNVIFERFSRLERHAAIPGSGIGLFVVKSIVAAHGGKVEVTSRPGYGTSFDVVFPTSPPVNERGELICLDFA